MNPSSDTWMKTRKQSATLHLASAWDIFRDAFSNYFKNASINQAAAIALYSILSIIPLFILSVIAAGHFLGANLHAQSRIIETIRTFHPYFSGDLLTQLGQLETKRQVLGWIGIFTLIWLSSTIFGAIETALDITFRSKSHRNFFQSKLLAFGMIPLGWTLGILSIVLTYVMTLLANQVTSIHGSFFNLHLPTLILLRYLVPFLVSVSFVTIVFKVIPSKKIPLRTAVTGSCLFTVLVELVKHVFTWYVANHTRYHAIFGSLEAVVILVIWVFYMALIFLFCAELMSSYERRDLILIEQALLKTGTPASGERLFRKFGRMFPAGSIICREGDHDREMFYILSGRVRLEKKAGHVKKTLAELGPGRYFGEMAAIIDAPRTASVIAAEDCDLAVIDGEVFHHLLRESDDLSIFMLQEFSYRIRHTNVALDDLSQSWIRMILLLQLIKHWPFPPNQDIPQALATSTGKDLSDVLETLKILESQGILTLSGEQVTHFEKEQALKHVHEMSSAPVAITP